MEKIPGFIKKFSKEKNPQERKQLAKKIKGYRGEYFSKNKELLGHMEALNQLEREISELSLSKFKKAINFLKIKNLRKEAVDLTKKRDISEKDIPKLEETKKMLAAFYTEQKRKWSESDYEKEDIVENFSEDRLVSLSIEEYALLLQRFPCEMVSHVTRQGVRDHLGEMGDGGHTIGEGAYFNNFMELLNDGYLRSPLGVYLVEKEKKKAIEKFLNLKRFKTKEDARKYLDGVLLQDDFLPGSYMDKTAVHFSAEGVADCYYGAEKGNEIFLVFPSVYIASNYYFRGSLDEVAQGEWNDKCVWPKEDEGMNIDAALIFIPKEARVDPKNGSRYELDEKMKPRENLEYKNALKEMVASSQFDDFTERILEVTGKTSVNGLSSKKDQIFSEIEEKFGIFDERIQEVICNYHILKNIKIEKEKQKNETGLNNTLEVSLEEAMKKAGVFYVEAKEAIRSEDFWEGYFKENPDKKPSKIVYYEGSDPTKALHWWRVENGIYKQTEDEDGNMGFIENRVEWNAPEAKRGADLFRSIAEEVIEEYFSQS